MDVGNQQFDFSDEKNRQLIKQRGISFDEIIAAIRSGKVLDIVPHPNIAKYPHQKLYVLLMNAYVYAVPFVRKDENTVFLKTIFPHRKLTRQYIGSVNHVKKTDKS